MIKIRWFSEYGIIGKYVLVLLLYSLFPAEPPMPCLCAAAGARRCLEYGFKQEGR